MTRVRDTAVGIWGIHRPAMTGLPAAGVVVAFSGLTALVGEGGSAWFVMPVAVAFLLALSIWREARRRRHE